MLNSERIFNLQLLQALYKYDLYLHQTPVDYN